MQELDASTVEEMAYEDMSINTIKNFIINKWHERKQSIYTLEDTTAGTLVTDDAGSGFRVSPFFNKEHIKSEYYEIVSMGHLRRWVTPYFLSHLLKEAATEINKEIVSDGYSDKLTAYFFTNDFSVDDLYIFRRDYISKYVNI